MKRFFLLYSWNFENKNNVTHGFFTLTDLNFIFFGIEKFLSYFFYISHYSFMRYAHHQEKKTQPINNHHLFGASYMIVKERKNENKKKFKIIKNKHLNNLQLQEKKIHLSLWKMNETLHAIHLDHHGSICNELIFFLAKNKIVKFVWCCYMNEYYVTIMIMDFVNIKMFNVKMKI